MNPVSKSADHLMYVHALGYRVTKKGLVKSFTGRMLRLREHGGCLEFTTSSVDVGPRSVQVHRLQAYQKFGLEMFSIGIRVRHRDGDRTNNHWENIILATTSECRLAIPRVRRLASARNARDTRRRLTMKQAKEIRFAYLYGMRVVTLCERYDLKQSAIYAIINNESYKADHK